MGSKFNYPFFLFRNWLKKKDVAVRKRLGVVAAIKPLKD